MAASFPPRPRPHLDHDPNKLQVVIRLQHRRKRHVDGLGLQQYAQIADDQATSVFQ